MRFVQRSILTLLFLSIAKLSLAGSLLGVVTDSTNKEPVSEALIWLYAKSDNSNTVDSLIYQTYTDESGAYLIDDIEGGSYYVFATQEDYYEISAMIDISEGEVAHTLDFALIPIKDVKNYIAGTVYDHETGGALSEANVYLNPVGMLPYLISTITGNDGSYIFEGIREGDYFLSAEKSGYDFFTSRDTFKVGPHSEIDDKDIYLIPNGDSTDTAVLTGFVYSYSDNDSLIIVDDPVYHALVEIYSHPQLPNDFPYYRAWTKEDGSYIIEGIKPGTYTAIASAEGHTSDIKDAVEIFHAENVLDFYLKEIDVEHGAIAGNVYFDGTDIPVVGAFIEFISLEDTWTREHVLTGNDGSYSAKVPVGRYIVSCSYNGFSTRDTLNVTDHFFYGYYQEYYDDVHSFAEATVLKVEEDARIGNIDFGIPRLDEIEEIHLSGTVLDHDGQPVSGAEVTIWIQKHIVYGDLEGHNGYFTIYTNEAGKYEIKFDNRRLMAYSLIVSANKKGFHTQFYDHKTEFYLANEIKVHTSEISNINFDLIPRDSSELFSISGSVESEDGLAIENVFVIAANSTTYELFFTFTGNDGGYALENLSSGIYYVLFISGGYIPEFYDNAYRWENAQAIELVEDTFNINATLEPIFADSGNGSIVGQITDNSGNFLSGTMVTVKNNNGQIVGYDFTDSNGGYSIGTIGGGSYEVQAGKVAYNTGNKTINTQSGTQVTSIVNMSLSKTVTAIVEIKTIGVPKDLFLGKNYPNPFNPSTTISFGLPKTADVKLSVFNIVGQEVAVLINGNLQAGQYKATWDGVNSNGITVSSGLYFMKLQTGSSHLIQKMILTK